MANKFNFFISAFISIFAYILIILLFMVYLQHNKVNKYKAVSKNTVLELELIVEKKTIPKKVIAKATPKKTKSKKIIKKSRSTSVKKRTNLKALFAKVKTTATKIEHKKVSNVKSNQITSRFKSKYKKEKREAIVHKSKLIDVKNIKESKKIKLIKNKGNYNKYYSNISNIILTRWYKYPIFKQDDYLVIVEITIDDKGKFSYYIISYSGNIIVDKAIKEFLDNETAKIYPIAPDGLTKKIKVNFKPEMEQK